MKRLLIWAAVVAFVAGMGVATFWDVPNWRLYTVNWEPLAMTNAENYCAAVVGLNEGFKPNSPDVQRCMEETSRDNETVSVAQSVQWACDGIRDAGWPGTLPQCMEIINTGELWMIAGGGLANRESWSDSHPRPSETQVGELPDERTNRGGDTPSPSYGTP